MDPVLQRFGDVTIQRVERPKPVPPAPIKPPTPPLPETHLDKLREPDDEDSEELSYEEDSGDENDLESTTGLKRSFERYFPDAEPTSAKKFRTNSNNDIPPFDKKLGDEILGTFSDEDEISDFEDESDFESDEEFNQEKATKESEDENTSTSFLEKLVESPFLEPATAPLVTPKQQQQQPETTNTDSEDYEYDIKEKLKEMGEISFETVKKGDKPKKVEVKMENEVVVTPAKKPGVLGDDNGPELKIAAINMRKNIREVMDETKLDEATLAAQRLEMERLQRVQEQQKLLRELQRQAAQERMQNKVISLLQGNNFSKPGPSTTRIGNTVLVKLPNGQTKPMTRLPKKPLDLMPVAKPQMAPMAAPKSPKSLLSTKRPPVPTSASIGGVGPSFGNTASGHLTPSVSIAPVSKKPQIPMRKPHHSDSESEPEEPMMPVAPRRRSKDQPSTSTTIDISSDDDCIVVSEPEGDGSDQEDDPSNSGLHTNDDFNQPDGHGRVLINVGHPEDEPDIFLAPQLSRIVKPHQIGGIRFLYDNVIESTGRFESSAGFGCVLAHSMGLGKTLQIVCFCDIFLRNTSARHILCIQPINTLQNWLAEFNMWLPTEEAAANSPLSAQGEVRSRNFNLLVLNDSHKTLAARAKVIHAWRTGGGVLLIGYEQFRLLSLKKNPKSRRKTSFIEPQDDNKNKALFDAVHEALIKPGPDLVICDEGHRIKNSHASISQALKQMRTRRRIVLTGYPLQNNLMEYWCMVDFARPNYLGTKTEFCNMFERPIMNGQCIDSTEADIKLMRYRAHVLHSLLVGFVQRRSHRVLQSALPQKEEYVLLVRMTNFQRTLYETFMNEVVRIQAVPNPLKAFAVCCKIWNHPDVLFNFLKKRAGGDARDIDLEEVASVTGASTEPVAPIVKPKRAPARPRKPKEPRGKAKGKPAASVTPYNSSSDQPPPLVPLSQNTNSNASSLNIPQNQNDSKTSAYSNNFNSSTNGGSGQLSQQNINNFSTNPFFEQSNSQFSSGFQSQKSPSNYGSGYADPGSVLSDSTCFDSTQMSDSSGFAESFKDVSLNDQQTRSYLDLSNPQAGIKTVEVFSAENRFNQTFNDGQNYSFNQPEQQQGFQNTQNQQQGYQNNQNQQQSGGFQNNQQGYQNNQGYQQQNVWGQNDNNGSNQQQNSFYGTQQNFSSNFNNSNPNSNSAWIKKEEAPQPQISPVTNHIVNSPAKSETSNDFKPKINIISDIKLPSIFQSNLSISGPAALQPALVSASPSTSVEKKIKILSDIKLEPKIEPLDDKTEVKTELGVQSQAVVPMVFKEEVKQEPGDQKTPLMESPVDHSKLFSKLRDKDTEDGIPYDWAIDLMTDYVSGCIGNSAKMEILFCIIKESISLGDRLLVFSQSLITLDLIEQFLQMSLVPGDTVNWAKNTSYYRLDGSTSALEREKLINEFNANSKIHVFLVSTRAGSLGINLIGANRVVVLDASWNPCHDTQAVCRVYRYGQRKPCFVYRLVVDNCLEKKIYDRQINKQGMSDRVVDECNPDAHLTLKDVSTLCWDNKYDEGEEKDWGHVRDNYIDVVLQKVLAQHGRRLNCEPFQHESLLVDRKEKQLSQQEKRLAKKSYEREKQASRQPAYNSHGGLARGHRPVASVRPMQQGFDLGHERPSRWIPAEHWQRQGMTAQEMTLPLDVVIPTNQLEKGNIVLKAGQKVLVLKSPKGVYMQLESGKIVAIKTAIKVKGKAEDNQNHPAAPGAPGDKMLKSILPPSVKITPTLPGMPQKKMVKPFAPGLAKLNVKSMRQNVPNLVSHIQNVTKKAQMVKSRPYNIGAEIAKSLQKEDFPLDDEDDDDDDSLPFPMDPRRLLPPSADVSPSGRKAPQARAIPPGLEFHLENVVAPQPKKTPAKSKKPRGGGAGALSLLKNQQISIKRVGATQQGRGGRKTSVASVLEKLEQTTSLALTDNIPFQETLDSITSGYKDDALEDEASMSSSIDPKSRAASSDASDHSDEVTYVSEHPPQYAPQSTPADIQPKTEIPNQDYATYNNYYNYQPYPPPPQGYGYPPAGQHPPPYDVMTGGAYPPQQAPQQYNYGYQAYPPPAPQPHYAPPPSQPGYDYNQAPPPAQPIYPGYHTPYPPPPPQQYPPQIPPQGMYAPPPAPNAQPYQDYQYQQQGNNPPPSTSAAPAPTNAQYYPNT